MHSTNGVNILLTRAKLSAILDEITINLAAYGKSEL